MEESSESFELIRFAIEAAVRDTKSREEYESMVAGILAGGRVELRIETKDGLHCIISQAVDEAPGVRRQ